MPIKHLAPRDENEVHEYFSKMTNRELFNIGIFDEYAQNILNDRLRCKKTLSIDAEYLWPGRDVSLLATHAYVKVKYTMIFIISIFDIPYFEARMKEDFGESVKIENYNYQTEQLIITFTS